MSVATVSYLGFVALSALIYFIIPRKFRWVVLLLSSIVYYLIYDVKLTIWLGITSLSIYICGLLQERQEKQYQRLVSENETDRGTKKQLKKQNSRKKHIYAAFAIAINIGIWFYFKFADLFITSINQTFSTSYSLLHLALPLGISFYTLQGISYVIDAARNKISVQKNYFKLLLWLSFFPQIVQGPICRYSETAEQLYEPHDFSPDRTKFGVQLILWGLFKKLVIADRAAQISMTVFNNSQDYKGLVFVIAAVAYTIQIYGDFSGGMDIIGGVAEILGIYMPVNFRRPYFSRSISEYWRRWHITLGAWFRDYIFYPLSISKAAQKLGKHTRRMFGVHIGKMLPTYLAMIVVWTLNGIWHGAGAQYAVYGFYQGFLMILGMQTETISKRMIHWLKIDVDSFGWKLWQVARTMGLVVWGRILFKADNLREAFRIMGSVFRDFNPHVLFDGTIYSLGVDTKDVIILVIAVLILLTVSVLQERGMKVRETIQKQSIFIRWAFYYGILFAIIIFGVYGYGYKVVEFVYAQF